MIAAWASLLGAWFGASSFVIGFFMMAGGSSKNNSNVVFSGGSLVSCGTWLMIAGIVAAVANSWIKAKYPQPPAPEQPAAQTDE